MDYTDIREVRRTTSDKEANSLLDQGWEMHQIVNSGCQFYFLLVHR
ncbi:hypothetical protein P9578_03475 [Brevibacillus choshinensis]|nr:hypothetical protein [Brevibacillus choshinensis]